MGSGVGSDVSFGVGFGVGVAVGFGVGFGVGVAVGFGVDFGVKVGLDSDVEIALDASEDCELFEDTALDMESSFLLEVIWLDSSTSLSLDTDSSPNDASVSS